MTTERRTTFPMVFRGRIGRTYNRARWVRADRRFIALRWDVPKIIGPRSERVAYMLPPYQLYRALHGGMGYRAGDTSLRPWRFFAPPTETGGE